MPHAVPTYLRNRRRVVCVMFVLVASLTGLRFADYFETYCNDRFDKDSSLLVRKSRICCVDATPDRPLAHCRKPW